uniref:Uncharacterized protein n=1 Tax=Chromera velia CCMP2878 TaxID=1169474 RepID=A0A0G4I536_9ALVE|eukprot:Cvel_11078.t1-p1 / transcript=Cvel_11078.t1 / gene=Cvel_11078 / organism=Chromera_velia_CCMP2878 / gene_product=hypothetical protein / transcript_product=hypothetical protein / location=Cvel_scaffold684:67373-73213(+) / protein_length=127 / sequence_SO=supercontig / SO=protein_coding / is_pseudo=false
MHERRQRFGKVGKRSPLEIPAALRDLVRVGVEVLIKVPVKLMMAFGLKFGQHFVIRSAEKGMEEDTRGRTGFPASGKTTRRRVSGWGTAVQVLEEGGTKGDRAAQLANGGVPERPTTQSFSVRTSRA